MTDEQAPDRKIKKANRKVFTEKNVLTLRARRKQYMVWDGGNGRGSGEVVRGLGILVSPIGAKSYRSVYYFPGSSKSHSRHLGRVGEMTLEEARKLCREDRGTARSGNDPRADDPSKSASYQAAVDDYIKRVQIGQDKNSSAEQARRVLLADCEDWHQRPLATIRNTEIQRLLELVRAGDEGLGLKPRPYLANLLYARMRPFFNWCAKPTINKIKHNPRPVLDRNLQIQPQ